ncbi:hypothetical protein VEA_000758 [Vibrio antiquarius]|nr:hypothetical protein VEA_000758 [Vibrio antiquarius]
MSTINEQEYLTLSDSKYCAERVEVSAINEYKKGEQRSPKQTARI